MPPTTPPPLNARLRIRRLGLCEYSTVWQAMRTFTETRTTDTPDEVWIVEHPPVYTQGVAGKAEHYLYPSEIPIVHSDRGGQITYHGPGQLIIYTLLDIRRRGLGVKTLVTELEQCVIDSLAQYGIRAQRHDGAPGVYVDGAKIASLGLRVRQTGCYHGLSLNVEMDLTPFSNINPCGYSGLAVTRLIDLGVHAHCLDVATVLLRHLADRLGYDSLEWGGDQLPEA